jgi:hypothetical protein
MQAGEAQRINLVVRRQEEKLENVVFQEKVEGR